MEEPDVKNSIINYLDKNRWHIHSKIKPTYIQGIRIIPDIVADKEEDLMAIECKGSLELDGLISGIGQCISYTNYGSNIVCFAIPKDREKFVLELINNFNLHRSGKVGLFIVDEDNSVNIRIPYKSFKLPSKISRIKKIILEKLAYVADIKIEDIGIILNFAYKNHGNYEDSREFSKLIKQNKLKLFSKALTPRMISNFMITFNNLRLWDVNYKLNEEGNKLRILFNKKKKDFKSRLAYLLLIEGNWIALLSIMERLSKKNFKKKKNYRLALACSLIKNNFHPPTKKIKGLSEKMWDRFLRFLEEFNFVRWDNKTYILDWENIVKVIRRWQY